MSGAGVLAQVRAQMWEEFTARTLAALREAAAMLAAQSLGYDHESAKGYWGSGKRLVRKQPVKLPRENAITHVMVQALDIIRENAGADDLLRKQQVCFPSQQPRKRQNRLGSDALTTDIQARSLLNPYLDLRIEAKVLFGSSDVAQYCGKDGLLRFADAEPYTDQPIGMMVGYTVRHEDSRWLKDIDARGSKAAQVKSLSSLALGGEILLATTLPSAATGEVVVLHVLLPFETKPSARGLDIAKAAEVAANRQAKRAIRPRRLRGIQTR